jgi:hypothetical protein
VSLSKLLLAHHGPEEYDRCYLVGRVHLCARCAGLYPALALMLALEISGVVRDVRVEWALLYVLPLPAVVSWARRRLAGASGSNPLATVTGALLGIALGRGIFLYLENRASPCFWSQAAGLALAVVLVETVRWLRRRRSDR